MSRPGYTYMSIDEMLAVPGFYEVDLGGHLYFRVEVDEDHLCHQLTDQWERDGLLSKDRWVRHTFYMKKVNKPCDIL